jgi:hypothetical protein
MGLRIRDPYLSFSQNIRKNFIFSPNPTNVQRIMMTDDKELFPAPDIINITTQEEGQKMLQSPSSKSVSNSRKAMLFPLKLHCMLEAVERNADDHVISWLSDDKVSLGGRSAMGTTCLVCARCLSPSVLCVPVIALLTLQSFKVHDIEGFIMDILPQYFDQTKYKSFQRQLNMVRQRKRGDNT